MIRNLTRKWAARMMLREPDMIIGDSYLYRWYVIPRNRVFNIYLHEYVGSDDDRALHDHPWWSLSWLLSGALIEHIGVGHKPDGHAREIRIIDTGKWRLRRPETAHRLELVGSHAVTLFMTGPKIRTWGFHCPQGWRPWHRFVDPGNPGKRGPGCD